jgi:hypothetical protein
MFDRHVAVGDHVAYATRQGSSMEMKIAVVVLVEDDRAKVRVVAGNDYGWQHGDYKYDPDDRVRPRWEAFDGYEAWVRTPHNLLVINGADVMGIRAAVMEKQAASIAAANARIDSRDQTR